MAHYNGFDVFNFVAGGFDGVGELHLLGVHGAWEEIGEWRAPFLCRVGQLILLCRSLAEYCITYDLYVLGTASFE